MEPDGEAYVKISWRAEPGTESWRAYLVTVDDEGFRRRKLDEDTVLRFEALDTRMCTGYYADVGDRRPCPGSREVDAGARCPGCRERDVYVDYVRGVGAADVDGSVDYSVYLAEAGGSVKVGVTRSGSLERRWLEQGASKAVEVESGLTSERALEREREISRRHGLRQRIRKTSKIQRERDRLSDVLRETGLADLDDVVDVNGLSPYERPRCRSLSRRGLVSGSLEALAGQVLQVDGGCYAPLEGAVLVEPRQRGFDDY
ncbi:MAG: DUF2797 domain-containing protein [Halobacteriota archaeon]